MSKHMHRIIINKEKKYTKKYVYNYSNTKGICIKLAKDYISIEVELTKIYGSDTILSHNGYLFPDVLKKALLLHLINYSENISVKTMSIQVDDEVETVIDTTDGRVFPIFSLIIGKLEHPFKINFSEAEINGLLAQTKTHSDSRLASLMALIISKSKSYEAERFIYLWMAFNGMYGYFSKVVEEIRDEKVQSEWKQIKCMQMLLGIGSETISDKKEKSRVAHEVISLIRNYDDFFITRDSLENGKDKELANKISDKLFKNSSNEKYNMTAYGYLLTQFSYYFRCNFIHANKPLSLFSYNNDAELKCLKVINSLLEEFIEQNLHIWFDKDYLSVLIDKALKIDINLLKRKT